jgi:hypothetical protein
MSKKDLEIQCPDCGSRLRIDRETGAVIAHGVGAKPTDLAQVKAQMDGKKAHKRDAFGAAMEAERGRKNALDALFKKATDQAATKPEDPESPLDDRWR